jgi:ABC-type branched-subunit amino acid transport system substrate-binding protein
MPIVNFYITGGAADLLQMRLAVKDNYNGQLLPGSQQYQCQLPSIPIGWHDNYRRWRKQYNTWLRGIEKLTPSAPPIEIETNVVSVVEECQRIGDELIREFNQWINNAFQIQLGLTKIVPPSMYSENPNDFSFILHTNTGDPELDLILQRLPFHAWDFLEDYPHAEITLSTASYASPLPTTKQRPQVLVILGTDPQIDFTPQQQAIGHNLADSQLADVQYWSCQQGSPYAGLKSDLGAIPDLFKTLRKSSPQVLIFIGHSQSTENISSDGLDHQDSIRIWINESESISLNNPNFRGILNGLKNRGLIFAAFISCDGLRIAQVLNNIGIPYLMVSREILPVHVAKDFLDEFLAKATEPGVPIHIALSYARQHLQDTLETITVGGCPNASTFPAIFQIPEQHSYILNPKPVKISWWKSLWDSDRILKSINVYPRRTWKIILLFIVGLVSVIAIWRLFDPPVNACDQTIKDIPYISCGEKSLLGYENIDASGKQGMEELRKENPNFEKAVDNLETSWKNSQKNPEVLIALSNTKVKLEQQRSNQQQVIPPIVKTIAVMIPASASISEKSMPIGFLVAVGEAQRAWNNTRHDWLLQVIVGNDENEPNIAKKHVVQQIINRPTIIGTVGPYSSYVAEGILPTYTNNKMTLISGTSTSIDLGRGHPSFFRTVSGNNSQVDSIIKFLRKKRINKVEFLHGIRPFSSSFKKDLLDKAKNHNIKVNSYKLTNSRLSPSNVIRNFKLHQSQILILCPDALIDPEDRENMKQIISINAGRIPIIGNEVVNEPWLFDQIEQEPNLGKNLILSLTWNENIDRVNFSPSAYHEIPEWWRDKNKLIPHRTVLTFDATNVLIKAIDLAIKNKLSDDEIKTKLPNMIRQVTTNGMEGITGKITFKGGDRVENLKGLSQPIFNQGKLTGYRSPN